MGYHIVNVLWAYRTSKRTSTTMSPSMLTYGQEAIILLEINVRSLRVQLQSDILPKEYDELIYMNLDELDDVQVMALDHVIVQKKRVAKA